MLIGPGVTTTNDDAMGRHAAGAALAGPTLRRACRVGGGVVFIPRDRVGVEAFVAAGAVVTRDIPARAVVMGVPARVVRQVGDEDLIERWRFASRRVARRQSDASRLSRTRPCSVRRVARVGWIAVAEQDWLPAGDR